MLDKSKTYCNRKQREDVEDILKFKNVGLLLNERLINLPFELVPQLHGSLPEDLKFTKKQDDIEDPREFDYSYLLVISKYAIENPKKNKGGQVEKKQKGDEKLYYKPEDEIFSKHAEVNFAFKAVFRETMEDGTKKTITGGGGPETLYKMIYLIKYSEFEKRIKELQ